MPPRDGQIEPPKAPRSGGPLFERLFDAAPAPIAVHKGSDHVFVYSNAAHDRAVGGRSLIGLPLVDAFPDLAGQGVFERFDAVFRTGEAISVPEFRATLQVDGEPLRRFYRQELQPWYDEAGAVAGVMSFAYDISEEVEAREVARANAQRLTLALEAGRALGTFDVDLATGLVDSDVALARVFGVPPGTAVTGETFFAGLHDDDRERVRDAVRRAIDLATPFEEEYRVVASPGGTLLWLLARGRCLRDADGTPRRFSGVVLDVTARKEAQIALQRSETRLRQLFDAIDEGYCLCDMICDEAGEPVDYRFVEVNLLFEQMTGLAGAAGRTALELVPNLERHWVETYARVGLGGETLRFENGSAPMGRWFEVFATPMAPRGRFALVFREVTARRHAETALRENQALLQAFFDNSTSYAFAKDLEGRYIFVNRYYLDAFGHEDGSAILGLTDRDRFGEDEPYSSNDMRVVAEGRPITFEESAVTADGERRHAISTKFPLRDREGRVFGVGSISTDITDRKRSEEHRQLLVAELNHRVKNTLALVQSLARQTFKGHAQAQEAVDAFQGRLRALASSHDVLTRESWEKARLEDLVRDALAACSIDPSAARIDGPRVVLRPKQAVNVTMALHELCTNARKYGSLSAPTGRVEIVWRVTNGASTPRLVLEWREEGGPPVVAPERQGFGLRMIEGVLRSELGAEVGLFFRPEGLVCRVDAPIPATGEGE